MTPMTQVTITDVQKRKWIETRSALLWRCPAFSHILFSMLNPTRGELAAVFTAEVPIAATDGSNLILNPETFFAMPLDERVFVVAHEILHCVLNHCVMSQPMRQSGKVKYNDGTALDYDHDQMNIAMDLIINDTLIEDKIGKFPTCGVHDPSKATRANSFMDVYRKIYKKKQSNPQSGQGAGQGSTSPSKGPPGFDKILAPGSVSGKDPSQATQDRSQTAWDTAVAAALAAAKAQGKLPAALERLLGEIVEPTVTWQDHIRSFFARKVGSGSYDWRRPDRRLISRDIYAPARSGNGCGPIVVAIDTSGSIGQKQLDQFFAEMRSIIDDVRPSLVHVIWCDAKVHQVDTVEDTGDLDSLKPHGGGGTDFRPPFQWIEENMAGPPECAVYLTDGYGPFPDAAPNYPVVWGDITNRKGSYPWGDWVHVEIK